MGEQNKLINSPSYVAVHFKTQETENGFLLDNGELGNERKLYYRELVARFGHHLALTWNLGEENVNTPEQRRAHADFFKLIDPYDSPVVIHNAGNQNEVFGSVLGNNSVDGVSIQSFVLDSVFNNTLKWVTNSKTVNRPWVVASDEQGPSSDGIVPDSVDFLHDSARKEVLWANLMAGGAGVEYYFGFGYTHTDLNAVDFRSRDNMWRLSRYALDFFEINSIPFWRMSNRNDLVQPPTTSWCLASTIDNVFVVYLKQGGSVSVNLPSGGLPFNIRWFDPRNGGALQNGSSTSVNGGGFVSIGNPPNNLLSDWAALIQR
jgi:Putative collagen-binding domain of a collagenase